jgi:hypothetical protein
LLYAFPTTSWEREKEQANHYNIEMLTDHKEEAIMERLLV